MADIPELEQTTRMDYTSPTEIASVHEAGLTGQRLEQLGNSVVNFGNDISEINDRKEAAKRNLDTQAAKQSNIAFALDAEVQAKKQASVDGSNAYENFQKIYDKSNPSLTAKYNDPLTQQAVQTQAVEVRNMFTERLQPWDQKKQNEDILNKSNQINQTAQANVMKDPTMFASAVQSLTQTYKGNGETWLNHPADAQKALNDGVKGLGETAVDSYISQNNFKDARKFLENNAAVFNAKEREHLQDRITIRESQNDDHIQKLIVREDRNNEKTVKEDQKQSAGDLMVALTKSTDPKDIQPTLQLAAVAEANGTISHSQHEAIKELAKDVNGSNINDSANVLAIKVKIANATTKEEYGKILDEVISGSTGSGGPKLFNPKSAGALVEEVSHLMKHQNKDPNDADAKVIMNRMLGAKYGRAEEFGLTNPWPKEQQLQDAKAREDIRKLMDNGMDRISAAHRVLDSREFVPPASEVPYLPGSAQGDLRSLRGAFHDFRMKIKNGVAIDSQGNQIKDADLIRMFETYKERIRWLQNGKGLGNGQK